MTRPLGQTFPTHDCLPYPFPTRWPRSTPTRCNLELTQQPTFSYRWDEAHARQVVEYYRGAVQRRGVADFFIRIQECRQPKPGTHSIVARLVGFDLYAAQLGQALFETAPSWKRKTLVGQ